MDDLITVYSEYTFSILSRCLLTAKAGPVLGIVNNMLSCIVKFCCCLIEQVRPAETQQTRKIYQSFNDNCRLLIKGIILLTVFVF